MLYYAYVLLCEDSSYYNGYARDVDSRVRQHMNGSGARYTRLHKAKRLVYTEKFDSIEEAMRRERKIKKVKPQREA